MKKSLVVGANSFIGSHLIQKLKVTDQVIGVYNSNTDNLINDIKNVSINKLTDLENDFDDIYIVSAFISGGKQNSLARQMLYKVNVELIDRICSYFTQSKIIYCSSVSVYSPSDHPITETSCTGMLSEYGLSKYWGEKIVQQSLKYAIVRLSSVYGPYMQANTIIPAFIEQAITTGNIKVWGDGSRMQNYIYVTDAINYLLQAANYPDNKVFLACAAESMSNKELAGFIGQFTNSNINFTGEDSAPSFLYNNKLSVKLLNYSPKISLPEGLKQTIKWLEKRF